MRDAIAFEADLLCDDESDGVEFGDGATARVASKRPLAPGQFLNLTPPHPDDLPERREYEFDGIPVEYLVVEV